VPNAEEIVEEWRTRRPKEVRLRDVEKVLKHFFPDQHRKGKGSHIVVEHPMLRGVPGYGAKGDFDIPVKNGRVVKFPYINKLVQTIELLREMTE
jgi:hypothetical protein